MILPLTKVTRGVKYLVANAKKLPHLTTHNSQICALQPQSSASTKYVNWPILTLFYVHQFWCFALFYLIWFHRFSFIPATESPVVFSGLVWSGGGQVSVLNCCCWPLCELSLRVAYSVKLLPLLRLLTGGPADRHHAHHSSHDHMLGNSQSNAFTRTEVPWHARRDARAERRRQLSSLSPPPGGERIIWGHIGRMRRYYMVFCLPSFSVLLWRQPQRCPPPWPASRRSPMLLIAQVPLVSVSRQPSGSHAGLASGFGRRYWSACEFQSTAMSVRFSEKRRATSGRVVFLMW